MNSNTDIQSYPQLYQCAYYVQLFNYALFCYVSIVIHDSFIFFFYVSIQFHSRTVYTHSFEQVNILFIVGIHHTQNDTMVYHFFFFLFLCFCFSFIRTHAIILRQRRILLRRFSFAINCKYLRCRHISSGRFIFIAIHGSLFWEATSQLVIIIKIGSNTANKWLQLNFRISNSRCCY